MKNTVVSRKTAGIGFLFLALLLIQSYYNLDQGVYHHKGYPENTSLFRPEERLQDFSSIYIAGAVLLKGINPYTDLYPVNKNLQGLPDWMTQRVYVLVNFPLVPCLAAIFALFSVMVAVKVFYLLISLGCLGALFYQAKTMVIPSDRFAFLASTITLFSLSHPFLFMLDRGNWEGLLLPLCWFYVLLYKNKNKFSWIFLGVAVCIKPQTALLGVLPILQEDYVSPIKAILLSIMILSITLFLIPGPIIASLISLKAGICFWSMHSSIRFNHTLSNIFPLLIRTHYSTPLGFFSFLIGILALLSLWKSRKKLNYTHQALALITMMITLVPISYDYTLIELFPIVALFIADALRSPEEGDRLAPMLLVLCLILSPKEEFIGISPQLPFGIGYIANAVLLLILLCLALCGFGGVSAKTMPLHPRTCDSVK